MPFACGCLEMYIPYVVDVAADHQVLDAVDASSVPRTRAVAAVTVAAAQSLALRLSDDKLCVARTRPFSAIVSRLGGLHQCTQCSQ